MGITLTTLVLGFLANPSIGALLRGPLESAGLGEPLASRVGSVLAMVLATVFSMIVGEMVPKTLAISTPLATAKVVAAPVRWFALAFRPMILVLNGAANSALRAMGVEPQEEPVRRAQPRRAWPRSSAPPPRPGPSTSAPPASSPPRSASARRPRPTS